MLVSVCMCTYKRTHLYKTLKSINGLALPENITLEVIVVDNDAERSAEKIVADSQKGFKYPIKYISQPYKNISVARNEYLKAAKGDYIASIDDDEVADKFWLMHLLAAAKEYGADVVFGRINSMYVEECPEWISAGGYFNRPQYKTGTPLTSGGTGSTLISRSALIQTEFTFDLEYGATGGEDADLFHRLYKKNYKLIFCNEAYVSEEVERDRLNAKFLIKKAIRIGQTFSRYRYGENISLKEKGSFILKSICKMVILFVAFILNLPLGKTSYFKPLLKMLDTFGKVSYFFDIKNIELYGHKNVNKPK